jgi:predicted RNase H-like nuclease (RuvC/YqgF family)
MREKWDEVHYADGSTYGEKTIERAVAGVSEYYDPEAAEQSTTTETASTGRSGQTRAYLVEKNRLLAERIAELEAILTEKEERIRTLEDQVCRLRSDDLSSSALTSTEGDEQRS